MRSRSPKSVERKVAAAVSRLTRTPIDSLESSAIRCLQTIGTRKLGKHRRFVRETLARSISLSNRQREYMWSLFLNEYRDRFQMLPVARAEAWRRFRLLRMERSSLDVEIANYLKESGADLSH